MVREDKPGDSTPTECVEAAPLFEFKTVRVGEGAPLGCTRCGASVPGAYIPVAELMRRIHAATDPVMQRQRNLSIQGQEPLLHPELPALIGELVGSGVDRLHLSTDGMGLSRTEVAAGLAGSGVSWVSVRLLAPDASTHNALIGLQGSFEMLDVGLDNFTRAVEAQGARVLLTGEIPACAHNLATLPAAVAYLAGRGVRSIAIDVSRLPRSSQGRAWIESTLDTGLTSGVWVHLSDPSFIDRPEGSLVACSPVRFTEVMDDE